MEDTKNLSSSETDLVDSWTLLNHADTEPDNSGVDIEETSDSESLEVLEVEHADTEQSCIHEEQTRTEESHDDETCFTNGYDYSNISDVPIFHIAKDGKVRKYVHHPNPYINMWLSVVMVIAIAIALGLGIGHYLGTKRFVKVKDMIHHLRYENQILEQELAEALTKHKNCEQSLQEKVRYIDGRSKSCRFSKDLFSRNSYLQDNCDSWMNTAERSCPLEENIANGSSFQEFIVNQIPSMFSKGFDNFKSLRCSDHTFGLACPINETHVILKPTQGDLTIVGLSSSLSKLEHGSNEIQVRCPFSEVKSHLTFLHSFLSKWNEFIDENVKIQSATHKGSCFVKHCNSEQLPNKYVQIRVQLNGNSNQFGVSNRDSVVISHHHNHNNNYCRSVLKQCSLQKDECKYNTLKCKSLQNTEMSLTFVKSDVHKRSHFIVVCRQQNNDDVRNSQDSNIYFIGKKHSKFYKWSSHNFLNPVSKQKDVTLSQSHKVEKVSSIEGNRGNCKFRTCSDNKKQTRFKKSEHTSECTRKGECASKSSQLYKENHVKLHNRNTEKKIYYKQKYVFKEPRRKREREVNIGLRTFVKKDTIKHFRNQKRLYMKRSDKMLKYGKIYNKEFSKSKYLIRNYVNAKSKYFDKLSCTKNKHKKSCKQYNSEKSFHRFPVHKSKIKEDHRHHIYSKFGDSLTQIHEGKRNKGDKKNSKNNTFLQHSPSVLQGGKIKKYWKERNKTYQINIQNMNIFKF